MQDVVTFKTGNEFQMRATSHIVTPHLSLLYNKRELFRKLLKKKNGMIERILIKIRGIPPNVTENLQCALMGGAPLLSVTWSL